ncbi:hypothetical protein B6U96_16015 [Archaeoglobales archaeon ex4484_92]|nr:MAG: hypothetical protein B6U96_16015 [Archaeoglobales archaeon ex4484_92]
MRGNERKSERATWLAERICEGYTRLIIGRTIALYGLEPFQTGLFLRSAQLLASTLAQDLQNELCKNFGEVRNQCKATENN